MKPPILIYLAHNGVPLTPVPHHLRPEYVILVWFKSV